MRYLVLAPFVVTLLGCQAISGLNELEADRAVDGGRADTIRAADGGRGAAPRRAAGGGGGSSGCGGSGNDCDSGTADAATGTGTGTASSAGAGGKGTAGEPADELESDGGSDDCSTRITYGSAWIRPADHPGNDWDDASGLVTWDGSCEVDAAGNSVAQLSNGWRPFFEGRNSCVIALDAAGSCAPKDSCTTRIYYGSNWLNPEDHPDSFDDVAGAITTSGECLPHGDESSQKLSNGWEPHFKGSDGCAIALRYGQCGGLFANPVLSESCPDLSVLRDGDRYVMTCTSENPAYPIRTSDDLVHWKMRGSIFSQDTAPKWASGDFWAPEIHRIGDHFVAYFSARHTDGALAVGAASSSDVLGPYRDIGAPLVRDDLGAIDAHQFEAPDGMRYLLWKVDGNASGNPTPIKIQPLTADGLALSGAATTLSSNTDPWEGALIEHPWLIFEAGYYYLFYAANDFDTDRYAVGVARATVVTGPYTKAPAPVLSSGGGWAGPGVGSVVRSPDDSWVFVFDAWEAAYVGQAPPGRQALVTRIGWADGWPTMLAAPSSLSQPLP